MNDDILQTVRRWQDPGIWQAVEALAANANELQSQANKLGGDARLLLDRGDIEQTRQMKSEADHIRQCAADVLRQRAELAEQFIRIESWVREHRPDLLEFVPIAQFDGDRSEAIRDLKRLEARFEEPIESKHIGTTSGPSGQTQNKIPQPEDVSEFYRLQNSADWKDKSKTSIHKHIADNNAKKQGCELTAKERTTEAERIKKAIRDYEKKVAKLQ